MGAVHGGVPFPLQRIGGRIHLGEIDRQQMGVAEGVVDVEGVGVVGGVGRVGDIEPPQVRGAGVEVGGQLDIGGRLGGAQGGGINLDTGQIAGNLTGIVELIALDVVALGRSQKTAGVEPEGSGAGIEGTAGDRFLDDEEALALDRQVGIDLGALEGPLAETVVDGGEPDPAADLAGPPRARNPVGEQVGEEGASPLEADGVVVGDVVADDAHGVAVGGQAADAAVQRCENAHDYPPWVKPPPSVGGLRTSSKRTGSAMR